MIYRVYYNRSQDWPQCWSVDEGSPATEINVVGIELRCPARTIVQPGSHVSAWFEVDGTLTIVGGKAIFTY